MMGIDLDNIQRETVAVVVVVVVVAVETEEVLEQNRLIFKNKYLE
jgi:hypothetical protein